MVARCDDMVIRYGDMVARCVDMVVYGDMVARYDMVV